MQRKRVFTLTLTLLALAAGPAVADGPVMKTQTFDADQVLIIPGVMALVMPDGDNLEVRNVPPAQQRDKAYRDVDLKAGDVLVMFNGKRIKGLEDLRSRLEELAVGDEMKFGIRRGSEMKLVAFDKAEADRQGGPQVMMMTMTVDEDDSTADLQADGPMVQKMTFSAKDNLLLLEAGMMLSDEDGVVSVKAILPGMDAADVNEGDRVVSFNGKKATSIDQLRELYDAVPSDTEFSLVPERDGEQHTGTYVKIEPGGTRIIKAGRNDEQ